MRRLERKDFLRKKAVLEELYRKLWQSLVIFLSEHEIKEGVWVDLYHRAYENARFLPVANQEAYFRMAAEYSLIVALFNAELKRRE